MTDVRVRLGVVMAICLCYSAGASPYCVPDSPQSYLLRTESNVIERLTVSPEQPGLLIGESLTGEIDGNRILLLDESEKNGYQFADGKAVAQLKDGLQKVFRSFRLGASATAFQRLYEEDAQAKKLREIPDIWQGRFRLWYKNPNTAAVLLVQWAVFVLAGVFCRRKIISACCLLMALPLMWAVLLTESRGAFLAMLAALAVLFSRQLKTLLRPKRLLALAGILMLAVVVLFASGKADRYTTGLLKQDEKTSRTVIWKDVPRMMVDAPFGWGWNASGKAYVNWYQPKCTCLLKDLIGSHFTDLVETGWIGRFSLVFLWSLVLVGALMEGRRVAGAVWLAFAIGGFFNPATRFLEMWFLPLMTLPSVVRCLRKRDVLVSLSLTALVLAFFAVAGAVTRPLVTVRAVTGGAIVNATAALTWVVDDDWTLHGGYWWLTGPFLRKYYAAHPEAEAMGVVRAVKDVPDEAVRICLVGRQAERFLGADRKRFSSLKEITFLSPNVTAKRISECLRDDLARVRIVMGEMAARLSGDYGCDLNGFRVVKGAERYLPNWIEHVLNQNSTTNKKEK